MRLPLRLMRSFPLLMQTYFELLPLTTLFLCPVHRLHTKHVSQGDWGQCPAAVNNSTTNTRTRLALQRRHLMQHSESTHPSAAAADWWSSAWGGAPASSLTTTPTSRTSCGRWGVGRVPPWRIRRATSSAAAAAALPPQRRSATADGDEGRHRARASRSTLATDEAAVVEGRRIGIQQE